MLLHRSMDAPVRNRCTSVSIRASSVLRPPPPWPPSRNRQAAAHPFMPRQEALV
jgi:hypothetical protein